MKHILTILGCTVVACVAFMTSSSQAHARYAHLQSLFIRLVLWHKLRYSQ